MNRKRSEEGLISKIRHSINKSAIKVQGGYSNLFAILVTIQAQHKCIYCRLSKTNLTLYDRVFNLVSDRMQKVDINLVSDCMQQVDLELYIT